MVVPVLAVMHVGVILRAERYLGRNLSRSTESIKLPYDAGSRRHLLTPKIGPGRPSYRRSTHTGTNISTVSPFLVKHEIPT
jgi:hypothetical protein